MISCTTGITSRDMKFLLDSPCSTVYKDVSWKMWWKWSNKQSMTLSVNVFHPTENTEESNSDEGMPLRNLTLHLKPTSWPSFQERCLTPEVRTNIANIIGAYGGITQWSCWSDEVYEKNLFPQYQLVHSVWYYKPWCSLTSWFNIDDFAVSNQVNKKKHHTVSLVDMVSRWEQISKFAKSCLNSCCNTTLPSQEWSWYQSLHHADSKVIWHPGEAIPSSTERCTLWGLVLRSADI